MIYMRHKNTLQYFILWLEQDLLETWSVCKISGTVNGKYKKNCYPCADRMAASQLLADIESSIRSRGFIYDDLQYEEYFSLRPQTVDEILYDNM